MKNSMQTDVEKFMRACDQNIRTRPSQIPEEEIKLRVRLMNEELNGENELVDSMWKGDLVGIADGLADLLYVVFGTAAAYGIDIQEVFDEVQRSNMTKALLDKQTETWVVVKDDGGKIMKPPTFSPAALEPIVMRQIKEGHYA